MIYLDNAATTWPKPPEVIAAVAAAMETAGSLGRSGHSHSLLASEIAYECRCLAGNIFDIAPEQVVFTMNATHGLNIAINTLIDPGDEVIVSGFEHNAVMRPLYAKRAKIRIAGRKLFDVLDTIEAFDQAVTDHTKAVICTHVSNVFGYILPIEEISRICSDRGVPLIIDAAQSAGILPVSASKLNAAFIAMPGHKGLFGPQGTGLLLCRHTPRPFLYGGTGSVSKSMQMPDDLPDRVEAGTQNIHGIAGLLAGLRFVAGHEPHRISEHETALIMRAVKNLSENKQLKVFYSSKKAQSGVLSFIHQKIPSQIFAELFSAAGIAVRTGLHCAPVAHESAGTLSAGTVRVSVSLFSEADEIDRFCQFVNNVKI